MKIIVAADLHIRSKNPISRKGDYFSQVLTKFREILQITENNSGLLFVAGDFFDSAKAPYYVVKKIIEIIKKYDVDIYVVPGQHDLLFHVGGLDNTPLGILQAAGVIKILSSTMKTKYYGISFIGSGWNDEPQEEADILITHRMITYKGELWPGQKDFSTAAAIMRKYPWAKVIVSGDNHLPHIVTGEGRYQINCGSMMRSSKDQIDFKPGVYLIDTKGWKFDRIHLHIEDPDDVFDFSKITIEEMKKEAKKEAEAKISKFINSLPKTDQERPNFKRILSSVIEQADPSKAVKELINQTMERISK